MPDPNKAAVFFLIMTTLIVVGEYLHLKVLIVSKRENSILKNTSKMFVYAQMIFWPLCLFLITITNFIHPVKILIGQIFCTTIGLFIYFLLIVICSHSFICVLMRYLFIVHTAKTKSYGKEKVKRLFLILYIAIPLFMTIWKANDGTELQALSFVNKCYGQHHEVFLIETSALNVFKKNFCEIKSVEERDFYAKFIAFLYQLACFTSTLLQVVMGLNIAEVIVYYRIFSHMNR